MENLVSINAELRKIYARLDKIQQMDIMQNYAGLRLRLGDAMGAIGNVSECLQEKMQKEAEETQEQDSYEDR